MTAMMNVVPSIEPDAKEERPSPWYRRLMALFLLLAMVGAAGLVAQVVDGQHAGAQGPPGTRGEQGVAGPQGPQGDTGQRGPAGPEGKAGKNGSDGRSGPQGAKGDRGPQGARGQQGPAATGWVWQDAAGNRFQCVPSNGLVYVCGEIR